MLPSAIENNQKNSVTSTTVAKASASTQNQADASLATQPARKATLSHSPGLFDLSKYRVLASVQPVTTDLSSAEQNESSREGPNPGNSMK